MDGWQRHRSAPVGVLFAGAVALLLAGTVATVFYLSVVRSARGLPAYTAGIPRARVARPLAYRASYDVRLHGPLDRRTPAGTPSVAHSWSVALSTEPDDPLCWGAADDDLMALDDSGSRRVELPVPAGMYQPLPPRPVPARLLAVCPEAAMAQTRGPLEYTERVVPPDTPAEVVACGHRAGDQTSLAACNDGAPSRIYSREPQAQAKLRARGAIVRVAVCAAVFALLCFAAGLMALRRFDREHKVAR